MLHFIYRRDYLVEALPAKAESSQLSASDVDISRRESTAAVEDHVPLATHELQDATQSQALVPVAAEASAPATLPAIAHIHVYAIAGYYEIPTLKELALKKFIDPENAVEPADFAYVVQAAYLHTSDDAEELRRDVLAMALARVHELTEDEDFIATLAAMPGLHNFMVDLLPSAVKFAHVQGDKSSNLKAVVKMQQKDLTQAQKALTTAEAKAKKAVEQADQRLAELITIRRSLKDEKAKFEQVDIDFSRKLIALDDAKAKVRDVQTRADQHLAELITLWQLFEAEKAKSGKLAKQARINRNEAGFFRKSCEEQHQVYHDLAKFGIDAGERATVQGTELANLRGQVEVQKGELITLRAQIGSGMRGKAVSDAAIGIFNQYGTCRNCHWVLGCWLERDDRSASADRGLMVKCSRCKCRHYGELVG